MLLLGQVLLGSLELRLLDTDDHSKKLVLKTELCHNEVDNRALGSSLRLVMRVNQLGLEVELEAVSNLDFFRAELDHECLASLDELTREERVEDSVDFLTDAFDHENLAGANGELDLFLPMLGGKLDALHISTLLATDPLDALKLWVNEERITRARRNNGGVLS